MRDKIRKAGVVTALAVAALMGTGVTSALAATSLGPYAQESNCLRAGTDAALAGEWEDYDCVEHSPGAWYIHPIY